VRSVLRSVKKRKKSRRLGEVEVISRDEYAEFDVSVKKRKKSRRLGEVEVISRDEYAEFDVNSKVEMIRALVSRVRSHVNYRPRPTAFRMISAGFLVQTKGVGSSFQWSM